MPGKILAYLTQEITCTPNAVQMDDRGRAGVEGQEGCEKLMYIRADVSNEVHGSSIICCTSLAVTDFFPLVDWYGCSCLSVNVGCQLMRDGHASTTT